jgi:hypothetical protein
MYRIAKWSETFENADTRKRARLGWFLTPSGNDSGGYVELMSRGQDGILAFAVFQAICQWSATCLPPVRGLCARSDGRPYSARQLATLIRMPEAVVETALELLSSPDVGWIEVEEPCENTGEMEICQSSASCLPPTCQLPADCVPQGEGEGKGEGEGEVLCGLPAASSPHASDGTARTERQSSHRHSYPDEFERFWTAYPPNAKGRKRGKAATHKRWAKLSGEDRELIIEAARTYAAEEREFVKDPERFLKDDFWRDYLEVAEARPLQSAGHRVMEIENW